MRNNELALNANNVTGGYSSGAGVFDISLEIESGVCCGLFGPNGSGKTTMIRLLTGLLQKSSGSIIIRGTELTTSSAAQCRENICVVGEGPPYKELTVRENVLLWTGLYHRQGSCSTITDAALEQVGISALSERLAGTLSKGQRQKLKLARSLAVNAPIYILDEPFDGLDPTSTRNMLEIFTEKKKQGASVLLCSHDLYSVDSLCDKALFLDQGRVIVSGNHNELLGMLERPAQVLVHYTDGHRKYVKEVNYDKRKQSRADVVTSTINEILADGHKILSVPESNLSLEDLYLDIFGQEVEQ
ncbi:MAG: ABC transporter ATP-binding protein [Corynebacterium sp.]|nr:ABC transporter ATP-binding protein [Corynebacterium sp.]